MRRVLLPALFCAAGLVASMGPMIFSGFRVTQTEPGDVRLNHYLVEWTYRWLLHPIQRSFWDPPAFFPARNVMAYSDLPLGGAPLYWLLRLVHIAPDTSFQLWLILLSVCNFTAAWLFLRRAFGVGAVAASLGALLFAFCLPRTHYAGHTQFWIHFYTVAAFYGVHQLFAGGRWAAAFLFGGIVGQLYSGWYLGWFLIWSLCLLAVAALALDRRRLLAALARQWLPLVVGAALAAAALAPLYVHYRATLATLGYRPWQQIEPGIPSAASWFLPSEWAWLPWDRWFTRAFGYSYSFVGPRRHFMGIGPVTTALCLFGLYRERRRLRVLLLAALLLYVSTTHFGDLYPYAALIEVVPGAGAISVVASVCLVMCVLLAAGLAFVCDRARWWGAAALSLACFVEQGGTTPAFDKLELREAEAAIRADIPADCRVLFYRPSLVEQQPSANYQMRAMFAALEAGVPTVNGYSGNHPPDYPFPDLAALKEIDDGVLAQRVGEWLRTQGAPPSELCVISQTVNNAACGTVEAPGEMLAGRSYPIRVTMNNTGSSAWTKERLYALGFDAPQDDLRWGLNRVRLPAAVAPGSTAFFDFQVQAPAAPGRYPFAWRMVKEFTEWFGCRTPERGIEVK
jgi:hypothetical protein